jgi:hypothetical protein
MDDKGHLTGWTALLLVAGIVLMLAGGGLAPDSLPTYLMVAGWGVTLIAFNNIYRRVRTKVDERQIREDQRSQITGLPPQDRR